MSQPLTDTPRGTRGDHVTGTQGEHGSLQVKRSTRSINASQNDLERSALIDEMTSEANSSAENKPASSGKPDSPRNGVKIDGSNEEEATTDIETTKIILSGQCLTTFPRHLLRYSHVTDLELPDNLLRRLPSDIRRMTNLVRINLSHNPILCRNPDDYIGLPVELASLTLLSVLVLADCRLRYVPPIVWRCSNLTQLDISRNYRLDVLPPDIGQLTRLRQLDARSTGLSTIPDQIVFCRHLERLILWGNPIDRLPEAIAYLPRLHRFDVDFRRFAEPPIVDDYASGLLRDGAFESGHLPDALFEMPALEQLDLDGAKINRLPREIVCPLTELRIGHNYFRSIPLAVYDLALRLEVLDLSGNQLTEIPPEIGQLIKLRTLAADDNQIAEISEEIGRLHDALQELSVARNCLTKLPRSIGSLRNLLFLNVNGNCLSSLPTTISGLERLETLDVSENQLTRLPVELARLERIVGVHGHQGLGRRGLWLTGNPLVVDPFIWKTVSRKKLYDYLTTDPEIPVHAHSDSFNQRKLIVIGNIRCGKSFLVKTLTGTLPILSESSDNADCIEDSGLVRFVKWTTAKRRQKLLVVDLEGDGDDERIRRATTLWPLFCADRAVYLIVFDQQHLVGVKDEDGSKYWRAIGRWIDFVLERYPLAAVQVVGVQCGPISTEATLSSTSDVTVVLENGSVENEDRRRQIEHRIREQLKQLSTVHKNSANHDDLAMPTSRDSTRDPRVRRKASASSMSSGSSYVGGRRSVVNVQRVFGDGLQPDVLFVCPTVDGTLDVEHVRERIESLSGDRKFFPEVAVYRRSASSSGDQASSAWAKFKARLRMHITSKSTTFWLNWNEVESIATDECGVAAGDVVDCLLHMNRTGDAVWYPDPDVRLGSASATGNVTGTIGGGIVFPRPRRLVEILRPIFRRDLPNTLNFSAYQRLYTAVGRFTSASFGVARSALLTRGAATERMLACLWTPLANSVEEIYQLIELMQFLKLGVAFVENSGLVAEDKRRQHKLLYESATSRGVPLTPAMTLKLFERAPSKVNKGAARNVAVTSDDVTT